MIESLFQFYLDHPEKLPRWYAEQAQQGTRHRVICDYIAGMTDHYVQRLHQELLGTAAVGKLPARFGTSAVVGPEARETEPLSRIMEKSED